MNLKTKKIILSVVIATIVLVGIVVAVIISQNSKAADYDEVVITSETTNSNETTTKKVSYPFDLDVMVKRTYELNNLFSVTSFNSPSDISANKIVQYAFCYIYNDSLVDMDKNQGNMTYRSATPKQINDEIKTLFNITGVNIKSSDLYNKGDDIFEMWQPNYNADVQYNATVKELDGHKYEVSITYFTDNTKSTISATKTIIVSNDNNNYYISSMK